VSEVNLPESVLKVIRKAVDELRPTGIILFGSRARGTGSPTSDFDFALLGVKDEGAWTRFFNYVQYDAPTLYAIDLVRYEQAPEALRKMIDIEGRRVL
jgi:predicted nucleotidyltransferase